MIGSLFVCSHLMLSVFRYILIARAITCKLILEGFLLLLFCCLVRAILEFSKGISNGSLLVELLLGLLENQRQFANNVMDPQKETRKMSKQMKMLAQSLCLSDSMDIKKMPAKLVRIIG